MDSLAQLQSSAEHGDWEAFAMIRRRLEHDNPEAKEITLRLLGNGFLQTMMRLGCADARALFFHVAESDEAVVFSKLSSGRSVVANLQEWAEEEDVASLQVLGKMANQKFTPERENLIRVARAALRDMAARGLLRDFAYGPYVTERRDLAAVAIVALTVLVNKGDLRAIAGHEHEEEAYRALELLAAREGSQHASSELKRLAKRHTRPVQEKAIAALDRLGQDTSHYKEMREQFDKERSKKATKKKHNRKHNTR